MKRSLLLILAISVALGACSGDTATSTTAPGGSSAPAPTTDSGETTSTAAVSGGDEAAIVISEFAFNGPASVPVGTTVTVTNEDGVPHSWVSEEEGLFASGPLSAGDSFNFTFDEPGDYAYFCGIHPAQMTGTITVEG